MNKRQFKASEFINNIYKNGKKPVSLEYCDDEKVYNISCVLNWDKPTKDEFIKKINNFDLTVKALSRYNSRAPWVLFINFFPRPKMHFFKDHFRLRVARLNKLYVVKAPKLVIDNELQLLITLLIINNFALKDSVTTKVVEVLDNEA